MKGCHLNLKDVSNRSKAKNKGKKKRKRNCLRIAQLNDKDIFNFESAIFTVDGSNTEVRR